MNANESNGHRSVFINLDMIGVYDKPHVLKFVVREEILDHSSTVPVQKARQRFRDFQIVRFDFFMWCLKCILHHN